MVSVQLDLLYAIHYSCIFPCDHKLSIKEIAECCSCKREKKKREFVKAYHSVKTKEIKKLCF